MVKLHCLKKRFKFLSPIESGGEERRQQGGWERCWVNIWEKSSPVGQRVGKSTARSQKVSYANVRCTLLV